MYHTLQINFDICNSQTSSIQCLFCNMCVHVYVVWTHWCISCHHFKNVCHLLDWTDWWGELFQWWAQSWTLWWQWQRVGPWTNCCPYWTTPTTLSTPPSSGRGVYSVADCCLNPAPPTDSKTLLSLWPSGCTTAHSDGTSASYTVTLYSQIIYSCTNIYSCTKLLHL